MLFFKRRKVYSSFKDSIWGIDLGNMSLISRHKIKQRQLNKIIKEGGDLGKLLMNFLPKLIKPAISIGKSILAPLGLRAATSATDATIQKKKCMDLEIIH